MGVPLAIAGLVGAGVSAYGAYESGQSTAASYSYKAQVAANNAAIARQKGIMDIQSGEIAAVNQGLKTRAKIGSEKAQQGAAGIDVNSGSAVDLRAGSDELGMLDSLTIRSNAAKKAWSDEVEATSDIAQGQMDTAAGEQAKTAGALGAASSLLSGVSTVGGNFAKWQTQFGGSGSSGGGSTPAEDLAGGIIPV